MSNKIPSSAKEITDREDLRVGDIATFAFNGHEFTGPLWAEDDTLFVGPALIRHGVVAGCWNGLYTFIRAFRPAPALPAEPGAVILVTECRGERVDEPVVAWWDEVEGYWTTPTRRFDKTSAHMPYHITEWTPATVVPALEVSA